ncbi:ArsR/SmtB family transcription factor [Bosea sp. PAMC 26642]|uniref:ArsR/SmtB family transcription factor n=1 Tax=Bosea sp. (strain PAMC 26642) TaxID=1792307 RepID=UPI003FA46152
MKSAVLRLGALAHEGRLAIFRMLVQAGPGGIPAGDIARRLGVPPSSLSANLTVLSHAELVASRRDGRSIIYSAEYAKMTELLAYLLEDCCNGSPEICLPLAQSLANAACCASGASAQ